MKLIDGYYVDDNGNKWYDGIYTEAAAVEAAATMVNCCNCIDCYSCTNCTDCVECQFCWHCRNCQRCRECRCCTRCNDCGDCRDCGQCVACLYLCGFDACPTSYMLPYREYDGTPAVIAYWLDEKHIQINAGDQYYSLDDFRDSIDADAVELKAFYDTLLRLVR